MVLMRQPSLSDLGVIGSVHDEDSEVSPGVVVPLTRTPAVSGVRGRARLHAVCPLHGPDDYGQPCAKFSHLPGAGRGVSQPNVFRLVLVITRALAKPVLLFGMVIAALYFSLPLLAGTVGGSNLGKITPEKPVGTVVAPVDPAISPNCFHVSNPCHLTMPGTP